MERRAPKERNGWLRPSAGAWVLFGWLVSAPAWAHDAVTVQLAEDSTRETLSFLCGSQRGAFGIECAIAPAPLEAEMSGNRAVCLTPVAAEAGDLTAVRVRIEAVGAGSGRVAYRLAHLDQRCARGVFLHARVGGHWHALGELRPTPSHRPSLLVVECTGRSCTSGDLDIDALRACAGPKPGDCADGPPPGLRGELAYGGRIQ